MAPRGIGGTGRTLDTRVPRRDIVNQGNTPPAAASPIAIDGTPVTEARVGESYSFYVHAQHGVPPYFYSVLEGELPPGFVLIHHSGEVCGVPTEGGVWTEITVRVTDIMHNHANLIPFGITVRA